MRGSVVVLDRLEVGRIDRVRPHEPGRVSLVTAPAVVGEVPRPVQAGLGAGRSDLRLPPVTEPYWGTDPRSHRLYRRQCIPLVPPVYRRAF
jgi:hypothetical protein